MLCRIVGNTMDTLPRKLLDKELGIASSESTQQDAAAKQAQQPMETDDSQQAATAGDAESDLEDEEDRLPLFSHKVMAFVQHLLQYKVQIKAMSKTRRTYTILLWSVQLVLFGQYQ